VEFQILDTLENNVVKQSGKVHVCSPGGGGVYPRPAPSTSWRPRAASGSRQGIPPQARNSQDLWKTPMTGKPKAVWGTL